MVSYIYPIICLIPLFLISVFLLIIRNAYVIIYIRQLCIRAA